MTRFVVDQRIRLAAVLMTRSIAQNIYKDATHIYIRAKTRGETIAEVEIEANIKLKVKDDTPIVIGKKIMKMRDASMLDLAKWIKMLLVEANFKDEEVEVNVTGLISEFERDLPVFEPELD